MQRPNFGLDETASESPKLVSKNGSEVSIEEVTGEIEKILKSGGDYKTEIEKYINDTFDLNPIIQTSTGRINTNYKMFSIDTTRNGNVSITFVTGNKYYTIKFFNNEMTSSVKNLGENFYTESTTDQERQKILRQQQIL